MKEKKNNCDKTPKHKSQKTKTNLKNSNCDKTLKIKLWQNSKTWIVTVVIATEVTVAEALVTVVIVTYLS